MEVLPPSAGNGAKQWLSELGLEEPSLVRHLDSLFVPSASQLLSVKSYHDIHNTLDLSGSFLRQRNSPNSMNNPFSSGNPSQWDSFVNSQRPSKTHKTNAWDTAVTSKVLGTSTSNQPFLPLIFNHKSQQEPNPQHHHHHHHQHQRHPMSQFLSPQQQLACQNLEGFVASLPELSDEMLESVAPRTPSMDISGSHVLGGGAQESCASEVHSAEAMGSSCGRENSNSPADSFRGKRKAEAFPTTSDLSRMQRPIAVPVATPRAPSPPIKATGHTQDHIMAERKRREKLSQRFIALSAIVPGLKKMDKASVLGDAIKYVKTLQERVQKLEEQSPKKTVSSMAVMKNSKTSGSEIEGETEAEVACGDAPDIEARVTDNNVLIKIHCTKQKGVVAKCLSELEKLHLTVMNANIISFTNTTLDITVSAQTEDEHEVTADEVMAALQSFFKSL